jgi:hypothetical protein
VQNLQVEPADRALRLSWDVERTANQVFSGYYIYIVPLPDGTESLSGEALQAAERFNSAPFPGDTDGDPEHETYLAEGLDNGVPYVCFVRAVGSDGHIGPPGRTRTLICRPGGKAMLQRFFSGDRDGFDFSHGEYVNSDALECDIAYYRKDDRDHVISPSRIDELIKETRFWDAGAHERFDAVTAWQPEGPGTTQFTPRTGHLYVYRTAERCYGKIWITAIADEAGERTIRFEYMYQTIPELINLR